MNLRGCYLVHAPQAVVFAAICDPNALLSVIPGCRSIEQTADTEYRGEISLRAPGVVGSYEIHVRLVDADAPHHGQIDGKLWGRLGTIDGSAKFQLTGSGGVTTGEFESQAVVGGPLARLDCRFVEGLAGSLVKQGLRNLDLQLADSSEHTAD
jgi:carbon monoxide dehydrogenase subunit G